MATFYYRDPLSDGEWNNLGNWWMAYNAETDTVSVPATSFPGINDDVVLLPTGWWAVSRNSGPTPTVRDITVLANGLSIPITATGTIRLYSGDLLADPYDYNEWPSGVITGNIELRGTASVATGNTGHIGLVGNVSVYDYAEFGGSEVTGNITYYDAAQLKYGAVSASGDIVLNGVSRAITDGLFISANSLTFNDESYVDSGATLTALPGMNITFNGSSGNYGAIGDSTYHSATITFNGNSYNMGTVYSWDSAVIFNHNAANGGAVDGSATFNHNSRNFYIDPDSPTTSYGVVYDTVTLLPSHVAALQNSLSYVSNGPISYRGENGINGSSILGLA